MNTRELFEATITHEPPPRYDVDSLLARSRNRQRHRRFVATGSGIVVVAGVAAVTLMLPSTGTTPVVLGSPSATVTTPVTDGPPPLLGAVPTEPSALASVRLASAMRDAILAAAPDAYLGGSFDIQHRAREAYKVNDGWMGAEYWFRTAKIISANGRLGALYLNVERSIGHIVCNEFYDEGTECVNELGPHRENIMSVRQSNPKGSDKLVSVIVQREDGSQVEVTATNALSLQGEQYSGEDPPLTIEQVKAIALDPRITIYP